MFIDNHYDITRKKGWKLLMNKKVKSLMILSLVGFLGACNPANDASGSESASDNSGSGSQVVDDSVVHDSPYALLNGRKAKKVYQTLTLTGLDSLNYLKTSAQANGTHFANFVDGLLTHNEFGVLQLNLAEHAEHNDEYTEFKFKVRDDAALKWVKYDGTPYTHYENGADREQRVKAEDFVAGAKYVCTYKTGSDTAYLVTDFIRGAAEYYYYTQILDGIGQGKAEFVRLNTDKKKADWINKTMASDKANIVKLDSYQPLTAEDIPNVANGSRFGVRVDEDQENTVVYSLYSSAFYFPTLLTYSCYLPVNSYFLEEKGAAFGASSRDSILYCGPYRLDFMDETTITYKRNETYAQRKDIKGFMKARVETIKYNIIKSEIGSDFTRNQYEAGNIDGFGLSMNDTEGWEKYVIGPDGKGTLDNPYDANVNSRLLDTIGSMYGSNIVMERSRNNASTSYSTLGSTEQIKNTEKAVRLNDVRKAIMESFDYPEYYKRNANGDSESPFASQYLVHTYVPRNFVYDDNGNEYVDKYYTSVFAEKEGYTKIGGEYTGENGHYDDNGNWQPDDDTAAHQLMPGQFDTRQVPSKPDPEHPEKHSVEEYVDRALEAINLYNTQVATTAAEKISLPINIEYWSAWDADQESKLYDTYMINSMNVRLNKLTSAPADDLSNCPYFHVIPTDKVTTSNQNTVTGSASGSACFDFSPVLWGWGADYGDPLTFLATYKKGGDWKSIFPWIDDERVDNYTTSGELGSLTLNEPVDLLKAYSDLVDLGAAETENLTNRYQHFAEAEYMLINELNIYKPQVNYGQGWSLSVSKAAGYEVPSSNYGLSNERMSGMWVLEEPLTREERQAIRMEYNQAKKDFTEAHSAYSFYDD